MSYSTQGGDSKLDKLPEASREHIKEQMREMIIASRQWKPGEDVSDYPYEPSTEAQTDADLASQEREAWVEQLQKYQQREAAAYANSGNGGQGQQERGSETGQAANAGSRPGSAATTAANNGTAGQSSAVSQRQAGSAAAGEQNVEQISTEGVSENALSFLQGTGAAGMQQQPQQNETAASVSQADSADTITETAGSETIPTAPPGSLALAELAMLQGMETESEASSEALAEALAGTLDINDLRNMSASGSTGPTSAASASASGEFVNPDETNLIEPGTLYISELEHLDSGPPSN